LPLTSKLFVDHVELEKMIEWREQEHKEVDNKDLGNQAMLYGLHDYGVLKLFKCTNI